jgi:hypothetical protein
MKNLILAAAVVAFAFSAFAEGEGNQEPSTEETSGSTGN